MRIAHDDSGNKWISIGNADSPFLIDIMPVPGYRLEEIIDERRGELRVQRLEEIVLTPDMIWRAWSDIMSEITDDMVPYVRVPVAQLSKLNLRGVIASNPKVNVAIRFVHRSSITPEQALYELNRIEQGEIPPFLIGTILAAAKTTQRDCPLAYIVPTIIGELCPTRVANNHKYKLGRKELDRYVRDAIHLLIQEKNQIELPTNSVDMARFWLLLARELWRPWVRARLAQSGHISREDVSSIHELAFFHRVTQGLASVRIADVKVNFATTPEAKDMITWPQVLEWERHGVSSEALRYLIDGGNNMFAAGFFDVSRFSGNDDSNDDSLAWGLSQALLREAAEKGVYVPTGGFTAELPTGYPLYQWGITSLRVWAEPHALFVTLIGDGKQRAGFGWYPGQRLSVSPAIVPSAARSLIEVTLAALWRDLHVAGETVLPPVDTRPRRERGRGRSHQRKRKRRKNVRTLPGKRYARIAGNRQWGNDEERSAIQRQAHGVRGHLRRLRPGWTASENAATTAEEFGMTIPDGYTFVRPHVRGEGQADTPDSDHEVIIRSRGLASVMTLLGG